MLTLALKILSIWFVVAVISAIAFANMLRNRERLQKDAFLMSLFLAAHWQGLKQPAAAKRAAKLDGRANHEPMR